MAPPPAAHPHLDNALRFARRHPALSIAGAAGIGLLGGLELAAGLLLGVGLSSLVRQNNGRVIPERRVLRDRARGLLARTPHELVQRGRAVVQAARGELGPIQEATETTSHQPSTTPA